MSFFNLFAGGPAKPEPVAPQKVALSELEIRVDKICRALGLDPHAIEGRAADSSPFPPAVMEPLQRGNKIEAIRVYREMTNCGLKEAKDAIDAVEAGGSPQNINRFALLEAKLDAVLARVESDR